MDGSSELLTTGQAATLLACSRQHVVDLCNRGDLPSLSVGTHRRVRRADVQRLALTGMAVRSVRPERLRSLWLHRAVAGRLARDPERVLARAARNLHRLERAHPSGVSARYLARCRDLIAEGPEAVMRALVDESPEFDELRQSSPFAGVLSDAERLAILRAARRHGAGRDGGPRP